MEKEEEIGRIKHYYPKIVVAIVELKAPLRHGDRILIRGNRTNFEQAVESMQIQHENVQFAEAGKAIGLKVVQKVEENDIVYRV